MCTTITDARVYNYDETMRGKSPHVRSSDVRKRPCFMRGK